MQAYLDLVRDVLDRGCRKPSRTGIDTISLFSAHYQVDLAAGYPLLTTKRVNFEAVIRELLWYLSGENHIRNLRKHTKIWDDWADADGNLDTAYGHFWRHFPSAVRLAPASGASDASAVPADTGMRQDAHSAIRPAPGRWQVREIDQIRYVIDTLKRDPFSRRLLVTAWEPGNAITSRLPPCHYTFAFHVSPATNTPPLTKGGPGGVYSANANATTEKITKSPNHEITKSSFPTLRLNCHLTQRSGDVALGIPFNLAAYAALTQMIAQEVGMSLGRFSHTIIDAHIYCADAGTPTAQFDHVAGLREQLKREPLPLPRLVIARKPFDDLRFEDFQLLNYQCHEPIKFRVAV